MRSARDRISDIIKILKREFPHSRTALDFKNPLEILVATILAAQCTDERVNRITPGLFKKYPTAAAFAGADREDLEREIRSAGFFRNKARNIIAATKRIVRDFDGKVPDTMSALVTLPGVARKTANIVLSASFGKAEGIAVDTHVRRLAGRMGLSRAPDPEKIERDLLEIVPRENWLDFNFLFVNHGRKTCRARNPNCPECVIRAFCPSAGSLFPGLKKKS